MDEYKSEMQNLIHKDIIMSLLKSIHEPKGVFKRQLLRTLCNYIILNHKYVISNTELRNLIKKYMTSDFNIDSDQKAIYLFRVIYRMMRLDSDSIKKRKNKSVKFSAT